VDLDESKWSLSGEFTTIEKKKWLAPGLFVNIFVTSRDRNHPEDSSARGSWSFREKNSGSYVVLHFTIICTIYIKDTGRPQYLWRGTPVLHMRQVDMPDKLTQDVDVKGPNLMPVFLPIL